MSKENSERLSIALRKLGYVDPVSWDSDLGGTVKALCRVRNDMSSKWAKVVEGILLRAEDLRDTDASWNSHICRLYMLKDRKLVYGWLVAITAKNPDTAIQEVVKVIMDFAPRPKAPLPGQDMGVVLRTHAPPADAKGNPIVPESHRVEVIPMAGLHPKFQRNYPTPPGKDGRGGGRGAFGLESEGLGMFKPPVR